MPEFAPVTTQVFSLYGVQSRSCQSSRQRSGCRIPVGCAGTTRPPSRVVRKHLSCLRLSTSGSRPRTGGSHPDPAGATRSPVRKSTRSSLPAPLSAPKILAGPASPPTGAAMNTPPTAGPTTTGSGADGAVGQYQSSLREPLATVSTVRGEPAGVLANRTTPARPVVSDRALPWREDPGNREDRHARGDEDGSPGCPSRSADGSRAADPTEFLSGPGGSSVRSQSPGTRIPGAQGVGQALGLPISTPTTTGRPVSPIRRLDLRTRKRARPTPATASVVP